MTQFNQSGQNPDQPPPNYPYNQPDTQPIATPYQQNYQPQGYPPPPNYPPPNYYQQPAPPPAKKGFPGWAWGLIGVIVVALVGVVSFVLISGSNKTTPASTATATSAVALVSPGAKTTPVNLKTTPTVSAVTTKAAKTTSAATAPALEAGWKNYTPANDGFSIALPPDWQSVDQDTVKTFLNEGLKQLQEQNPKLSSTFGSQIQSIFSSGVIKFFGFSLDSTVFNTNVNVGKQTIPASMTLESYVQLNLNQIEKGIELAKPVERKQVKLPAGQMEEIRYEWNINLPTTGEKAGITTLQYMVVSNKTAYIITFTALSDEFADNLPLFTKMIQSFQLTN
jgi:uncharacterized protein (UPF0333 family)